MSDAHTRTATVRLLLLVVTSIFSCNTSLERSPATNADNLSLEAVDTEPEAFYDDGVRIVTWTDKERALKMIDDEEEKVWGEMCSHYIGIHNDWHYFQAGDNGLCLHRFHRSLLTHDKLHAQIIARKTRIQELGLEIPYRSVRPPEEMAKWKKNHGF